MNQSLKIKTNIKLVLISSFFSVFLFGLLSFHMFNRFMEESRTKFDIPTFLVFSFFILLLVTTTLFVTNFFSNIEVNEKEIIIKNVFSKKIIRIENIKNIILSEINDTYEILVDRTRIQLTNNEIINLYSFRYQDFFKLKIILNFINETIKSENIKIVKLNLDSILPQKMTFKINSDDKTKTFNFSHVLSPTGIIFYSFILMIPYSFFSREPLNIYTTLQIPVLITFFILLFSNEMNYFIITDNYLIVKNSIRFWEKKYFELDEIESINIHRHFRQFGKTVVIKTKLFENRTYSSDNLLNKHWEGFKIELKKNNVAIFDDSDRISKRVIY
ncbi:hypothetical protein FBBAL38_01725 [Flavobacteria bacterium BAL38]|nr:hypothetical protein FBBAL38_01725 [Flavobacteria bacterium BAL38]